MVRMRGWCVAWRVKFMSLGAEIYLNKDRLGQWPPNHWRFTLSALRYDMRQGNDEKFHGFSAHVGDFVGTWRLRGGRRWNCIGLRVWLSLWVNDEDLQLLHGKGIKRCLLVSPSDWNGRHVCLVPVTSAKWKSSWKSCHVFLQIAMVVHIHTR